MTIKCFWCKRLLWTTGEPVKYPPCTCVGHGRRRFHWRVRIDRLRQRLRLALQG